MKFYGMIKSDNGPRTCITIRLSGKKQQERENGPNWDNTKTEVNKLGVNCT